MLPSTAVSPKFCSDFLHYLPFSLVRKACSVRASVCVSRLPIACFLLSSGFISIILCAVLSFPVRAPWQPPSTSVCLSVTKCVPFYLQTRTTSGSSYTSRMWTMSLLISSTARCQCKPSCSWTHHQTHLCSPCRLATRIPTTTYTISSWETGVSIWFWPPLISWILLPCWICLCRSR